MAMFLTHIAFALNFIALAAGMITLHYGRQVQSKLIKWAAIILIIFGFGGMLCISFNAVRYSTQGEYQHAYGS